jgi:hypothetical protein
MPVFSFPAYLDHQVISELENHIIDICNSCQTFEQINTASAPIWDWACSVLQTNIRELKSETHESHEHFSDAYLEEKDHLLKLPLILLEKVNT